MRPSTWICAYSSRILMIKRPLTGILIQETNPRVSCFAIMLDGKLIGELQLKQINREKAECTLSIHMQNDTVKEKGYGTQAEQLAVKYAFDEMGMVAVNADTIMKNTRSQHVLEKVGFHLIGEDETFKCYLIEQ